MKRAILILAALIAGLLLGMATGDTRPLLREVAGVIGTMW